MIQLVDDLADRRDDGPDREREAIQSKTSVLSIADVVQAASSVRQQEPVLLAFPANPINVIDDVTTQQVSYGLE